MMILFVDTLPGLIGRRLHFSLSLLLLALFFFIRSIDMSELLRKRKLFFLHHLRYDPVVHVLELSEQLGAEDTHVFVHGNAYLLADLEDCFSCSSDLACLDGIVRVSLVNASNQ